MSQKLHPLTGKGHPSDQKGHSSIDRNFFIKTEVALSKI